MNKEEFRKHCEQQIERCIKLNDYKHLKEHELALSLLNECDRKKEENKRLDNQLKQKDKAIDECIELIAKYIQNCTYEEVPKYKELLEKLQQTKGDCDE